MYRLTYRDIMATQYEFEDLMRYDIHYECKTLYWADLTSAEQNGADALVATCRQIAKNAKAMTNGHLLYAEFVLTLAMKCKIGGDYIFIPEYNSLQSVMLYKDLFNIFAHHEIKSYEKRSKKKFKEICDIINLCKDWERH
jgi:hypothetical protein